MNNNLSKSLLTSGLTAFWLAIIFGIFVSGAAVYADNASEIRDHINRGNMLLSRRLFQEAITEYEEVLKIEPDNQIAKNNIALTHNNWGIYFYGAGKLTEAKQHWDTSLKLNPNDGNVRRNLKILEVRLRNSPPPSQQPEQDKNPKPTGPQDWNPFDESLDKVNNPPARAQSAAASGPPPATVTAPGQQEAKMDTTAAEAPSSGAVLILSTGNSSFTMGSTGAGAGAAGDTAPSASASAAGGSTSANESGAAGQGNAGTFRIVGGSTGNASIVGGGGTAASGSLPLTKGVANVFPTPGSTTGNTTPRSTLPATPARIPARPAGGSVPMSWPGGSDTKPAAKPSPDAGAAPGFLTRKQDESPQQESASSNGADSPSSVEGTLAKIENKVYGKVSKNMPILKRVERLEVDTMGKKKSGPIADRLKELKETYGL